MQNKKIKVVIFDIGNVLAYFCWQEVFERYLSKEELTLLSEEIIPNRIEWYQMDQGLLTISDVAKSITKEFPNLEATLQEAICKVFQEISPFSYAEKWVQNIKSRGYRVYILSNYGEEAFALSKERYTFLQHVDGQIISSEVKLMKPDHRIYQTLFERFGFNPEEAVFIDDNVDNIQAAKELGVKTVHFQSYEQGSQELETILSTY